MSASSQEEQTVDTINNRSLPPPPTAAGVLKAVKRVLEIGKDGPEIGTKIGDQNGFWLRCSTKKKEQVGF
jgi:hypothetical protein